MVWAMVGFGAGTLGAWLLRRLRRGAEVHWLWCAVPTALLWGVAAGRHPPPHWLAVTSALAWVGVLLCVTDLRHCRLPDALTLPAWPVAGVLIALGGTEAALRGFVGGFAFGAFHLVVRLCSPGALGGGDVKLAVPLGAVLGAVSLAALPLGALLACGAALVFALVRPKGGIPYGPGVLAATWVLAVFPL
jgi:leader peptidase (prepilin peptidase)/N-methyltransferase